MKKVLAVCIVLLLVGYGLFEARRILEGPTIAIYTPENGSATSTLGVRVAGVAHNISFLTINDKESFTDEEGNFEELLSPPSGITVVTVSGVDRFGRRVSESISITMRNYCVKS